MNIHDYMDDGRDYQSRVILAILQERTPEDTEINVTNFDNGRERGYTIYHDIKLKRRFVSFSEHRSSDSIIVYFVAEGPREINPPSIDNISHEVWENAKYFPYEDYDDAVNYILEQMKVI